MNRRRMSYGIAGLTLFAISVFGATKTWSYLTTAFGNLGEAIEEEVPLEFQLNRLQGMVDDLLPEVQKNRVALAEAEVDAETIERNIGERTRKLEQSKTQILALRAVLDKQGTEMFVGGRLHTRSQVESDLAARLDRHNAAEEELANQEMLLRQRQDLVQAARRKVQSYQREQQQLQTQVVQLETKLRQVESMKESHKLAFNHTKLAESKRLAEHLQRKLDVAQRVLADTEVANEGIDTTGQVPRDVAKEVDAKFGQPEQSLANVERSSVK